MRKADKGYPVEEAGGLIVYDRKTKSVGKLKSVK